MSPRFDTALRWLLVASLALNIGVLSGIAWHHFSDGEDSHRGHMRTMARATMMPNPGLLHRVLPEERRAVADAVMVRHREPIRATVGRVFAARDRVHELMTAETLDRDALDQAFADLRVRDAEAAAAVQAMLTDVAAELTPEERRKLGEAVHRHHPRARRGPRPAPEPDAP